MAEFLIVTFGTIMVAGLAIWLQSRREHPGVAGRLAHQVGKCSADRPVHAADHDFRHGVGELAGRSEDGGFAGPHDDFLGHVFLLELVCQNWVRARRKNRTTDRRP